MYHYVQQRLRTLTAVRVIPAGWQNSAHRDGRIEPGWAPFSRHFRVRDKSYRPPWRAAVTSPNRGLPMPSSRY